MITFYQLGQLGRLGNQLFQYAALRGLSLERGYVAKIPHPDTRVWHGQSCLRGNFNIEAEYYEEVELLEVKQAYNEPDYMKYDTRFYQIPDNTNLTGFFQSTLYFKGHEEQIKKELTPPKMNKFSTNPTTLTTRNCTACIEILFERDSGYIQ